jgi:legumain
MSDKGMFNKLVFYLEACEAGSVFDKQLPANIEVYAVTASGTDESSWGTYCPGEEGQNGGAMVAGIDIESCLGDLFSVNWMEDADRVGVKETLEAQYLTVQNKTDLSHVMQYGDVSYTDLPTGTFIASMSRMLQTQQKMLQEEEAQRKNSVPSRDIPLHLLYNKYKKTAAGAAKRAAMKALAKEAQMRAQVDEVFEAFAESAVKMAGQGVEAVEPLFAIPFTPIVHNACMNEVEDMWRFTCGGWNDYSTQYASVIINACRMIDNGPALAKSLAVACSSN